MQCVGGSREGTDECVRETKIPSASFSSWQLVALTMSEFWEGDRGGVLP